MIEAQVLINNEEIERFEEAVSAFLDQKLDAERFQSMRLQQGVYGQRQDGVNMIRVKIPGGRLTPAQMESIADVLEHHSQHDVVHITTRQAIQIHYVPLEKTPAALRDLAKAGLTTREACNNTVRNMSACALAGICPHEHTDITKHLDGAVAHFLRHPLTQHLPRKFKISFSACETDCAQGMMHDLGVVAVNKDGKFGFKVLAGGGLGHKPREAITVEEFIEEKDLLASMEAVITLHNRYSDRKKRAKSRIKFLVDRFGAEEFVEKYREEYQRTKTALAEHDHPKGTWAAGIPNGNCNPGAPREVIAQKQAGLNVFPISVPIGDLTAPQLRGIAKLMTEKNLAVASTTQDQNLILINVPGEDLEAIRTSLGALGLADPEIGDDVTACPGTSTCRLGITSSRIIGAKLNGSAADLRIRASGCHNGCAQPETGDIGIYGEGKRKHGKLIPHYQMYFGGDGRSSGGIGFKSVSIPAIRVEAAISRVQKTYADEHADNESFFQWSRKNGKDYFKELLSDLAEVKEEDLQSVLYDHGDEAAFKVLQLGGGECAGAAQETVAANFAEAANERNYRNAFRLQRKYSEALECAEEVARRVGQSLLFLAGEQPVEDLKEIARLISETMPGDADLGKNLGDFTELLDELKEQYDETTFMTLSDTMDQWTAQAADVCQNIDSQLDLSGSVPKVSASDTEGTAEIIDLTAFGCPLYYIKARNALRKHTSGDEVAFLFSDDESAQQASSSLESDGHHILTKEEQGTNMLVKVRKAG